MAKYVTRTNVTSIIKPRKVKFVDNKLSAEELEPITVENETVTEEKALKYVQKKYGKSGQYVITEIEKQEETFGMTHETFMKYAVAFKDGKPVTVVADSKQENESK